MAWNEYVSPEAEANWQAEYDAKQITIDQLFEQHITGGQKICMGGLHTATTVINEIVRRCTEGSLAGIDVWANWMNGDIDFTGLTCGPEVFRYHTYFAGPNERGGFGKCVSHIPCHFSDVWPMLASQDLDYTIIQMTPPDERGYCCVGPVGFVQGGYRTSKHIIANINPALPYIFGDSHHIHVSQIDGFIQQPEELEIAKVIIPTAEEMKVAEYCVDYVNDGDTIQLGIGGISNALAKGLESKQHLGAHTEMYSDSFVELQMKGIIDNSRKTYQPGKSIGGYSTGAQRLYDYIDHNPEVYYESYSKVCNPQVIGMNDNLVSINTAVSLDFTGQVCAESIGPRQYSASGGQFDFVRGVKHCKNGRGFIAVTSVAHTKKGDVSKIVPMLTEGSATTSLRNDIQYVATEYGVVNLQYCDLEQRAKKLISIAHPDFRSELTLAAKKRGIII